MSQIAGAANAVAQVHRMEDNLGEAEPLYAEVIAAGPEPARSVARRGGSSQPAMVYIARGTHGGARQSLQEVLAIAEETQSMPAGQSASRSRPDSLGSSGEPERSLRYFAAAEANIELTGIQRDPTDDAFLRPLIGRARAALSPEAANAAERAGHEAGYERTLADVRAWLAAPPVR